MTPPPQYVLVANDPSPVAGAPDIKSDQETQIAKLKAALDEKTVEAKTAMEEKEKLEAILKAANIFNQGNGTNNVNTIANVQDEPATKVEQAKVIAKLTALVAKPIIAQILTARKNLGDSDEAIKSAESRLTAMNIDQLETEYSNNQVFIKSALNASDDSALFAKSEESNFSFNGISSHPLVGKTFSMDQVVSEAAN